MVHKPFFKGYHPRFYFRTEDDRGVIQMPEDSKSTERSWKKDWDICEEASPGPWKGYRDGEIDFHGVPLASFMFDADSFDPEDERFITEAREALPYWIKAYLISQEEIKTLKEQLARANSEWMKERELRIAALKREAEEKRRADKLESTELHLMKPIIQQGGVLYGKGFITITDGVSSTEIRSEDQVVIDNIAKLVSWEDYPVINRYRKTEYEMREGK